MKKPPRIKTTRSATNPAIEKQVYPTRSGGKARSAQNKWWDAEVGEAHNDIFALVASLKAKQARYRLELATHYRSYTNYQAVGFATQFFSAMRRQYNYRISLNLVKTCVDAACALIAKDEPRIFVLPQDGDVNSDIKARGLQKFLDGQMEAANVYSNAHEVFRDACIFGKGAIYVYSDGEQIRSRQVKVDELIADEVDAMYGPNEEPQMLYHPHWVPKAQLLARYPKYEEQINSAYTNYRGEMNAMTSFEAVQVIEAWRKPSVPGGDDGRHVLCVSDATLVDEDWEKNYFPIVTFYWTPPLYGYRGMGIALELEALQAQVNSVMRSIGDSLHYYAKPRIFIEAQTQLTTQITNEGSTINQYSGNPPLFVTPPAMAADVYSYLQWLYSMAFAQIGLSQQQATSEKPAGLDSAVAMRTYQDIGTQRFAIIGKRWERWHVKVGNIMIDMNKDLVTKSKSPRVKAANTRGMENLEWSSVSMEDDRYLIQCWPTNMLPVTPEGKLAMAQELGNSGLMPPEVLVSQLKMPVLNDWFSEYTAGRDNIKMCIDSILSKGKYISPEPLVNLTEAINMSASALLRAEYNDEDEKKIALLRRFNSEAKALSTQPQPGMAMPSQSVPMGQRPAPPPATFATQGTGQVPPPPPAQ